MANLTDNNEPNKEQLNQINETKKLSDTKRVLMSNLLVAQQKEECKENILRNFDHLDENPSNMPAISSHQLPSQQYATKITVEKHGPFDNIWFYLGFSDDDNDSKNRQFTVRKVGTFIMILILFIIFLISSFGFCIMWFTNIYNDSLLSNLVLIDNTTAVKWWRIPPLDPHIKIHIFNYTNTDRFLKGLDKKLILQDLGPYVYVEKFEKVDVRFNKNYTISYRERRSYEFQPELSNGKQYDKIMIPNIPMLTAAKRIRDSNVFLQIALNSVFQTTKSGPFIMLPADSLIWGYDDPLIHMSQKIIPFNEPLPYDKFGLLATRNGTSRDVMTIFSGEDDIRKLALMDNFNGRPKLNLWGTDECNRLDGTDGSQFPPQYMDKKHSLEVFIKSFCRKFPLAYDSEVNIYDGIPAWRYKAPLNVFSHPSVNPANQCYCHMESGTCPPSGVFNVTKCFDAPIFSSFPHFFTGEESLFRNLDGLKPDETKHRTYADVHPRLAFPIDGASRFQINVQVHKASMVSELNRFEDFQILPVIWMEVNSGIISDELRSMIYHSTFSANAIQLSFKYGTLLVCVASLGMLVATLYYCGGKRKRRSDRVQQNNQTIYQLESQSSQLKCESEMLNQNNE